ncbi:MAG TPA: protocatechuate 3,4-dioxygenase [Chloroflexota bacterium]|jgi:hypothetical protein
MAEIAVAIGSSHTPGLNHSAEHWLTRAEFDRKHIETQGLGDYEALAREKAAWIGPELTRERIFERYDACTRALGTLAGTLAEAKADVVVIIGDDHREVFSAQHMPAFNIHWAEEIYCPPFASRQPGMPAPDGPAPESGPHIYPGDTEFAEHLLHSVVQDGFDVSHSRTLRAAGLGHAFDFIVRRIMNEERIPLVPVLLNTYYAPNQPTAARCYALGRAIRRAIDDWPSDKRVAIIGSGGLTHHIIDEAMDKVILNGIHDRDVEALTSYPEQVYVDGTSEIKAWITLAGVMEEDDREMQLVDYQPFYRSPAGTGCANAFVYWR